MKSIQLSECRFLDQAPSASVASAKADELRKGGSCVRVVIRRSADGSKVWKLFETKRRSDPQLSQCPTCHGRGRVPHGSVHAPTPAAADVAALQRKPKRALKLALALGPDSRLASNVAAHSESPYAGPELRGARAAAERKRRMRACPCRLCALCLKPPQTFAEAESFGIVYGSTDTEPGCVPIWRKADPREKGIAAQRAAINPAIAV